MSNEPLHTEQVILARLIMADEPITIDGLAEAGSADPEALIDWAAANGYLYGGAA